MLEQILSFMGWLLQVVGMIIRPNPHTKQQPGRPRSRAQFARNQDQSDDEFDLRSSHGGNSSRQGTGHDERDDEYVSTETGMSIDGECGNGVNRVMHNL